MQRQRLAQVIIFIALLTTLSLFGNLLIDQQAMAGIETAQSNPARVQEELSPVAELTNPPSGTADNLARARLEERILESVVRLEYRFKNQGFTDEGRQPVQEKRISHATVKDGRYLILHNHFAMQLDEGDGVMTTLTAYKATGQMIFMHTGASPFSVAIDEEETLVLDFGLKDNGQGYFEWMGLSSASFKSQQEAPLAPGVEVAQVNYDGKNTTIKWTTVEEVTSENGPPRLVLSGALSPGASGGGVFWNGHHVANNWQLIEFVGKGGDVVHQVSTAALNSPLVTAAISTMKAG